MSAPNELIQQANSLLKDDLNESEKILWVGKSNFTARRLLRQLAPSLTVIAVSFALAPLICSQMTKEALPELPFISLFVFVVFCLLLWHFAFQISAVNSKALFVLSNQRVFSIYPMVLFYRTYLDRTQTPGLRRTQDGQAIVQSATLNSLPQPTGFIRADGSGTIVFCYLGKREKEQLKYVGGMLHPSLFGAPVFAELDDARSVFEQVSSLIQQERSQPPRLSNGESGLELVQASRPPRSIPGSMWLHLIVTSKGSIFAWAASLFLSIWSSCALNSMSVNNIKEDPASMFLIPALIAGAIGFCLPIYFIWQAFKKICLLQNGSAVYGRVIADERPFASVNGRVVLVQRSYEYVHGSRAPIFQQVVDANWVEKEPPLIFFDPNNAGSAMNLYALPGHPTISNRGQIQIGHPGIKTLLLVLPIAVLLFNLSVVNNLYTQFVQPRLVKEAVYKNGLPGATTESKSQKTEGSVKRIEEIAPSYNTVYDVTKESASHWFPAYAGSAFAMTFLFGILYWLCKGIFKRKLDIAISILAAIFLLFWLAAVVGGQLSDYLTLSHAYKSGRCELVEGVVTNFAPMPPAGHKDETFQVNGKSFAYSSFSVTAGFNKTACHGGPIKDGLKVRIWHLKGEIARLDVTD
jgi:hypothetical protein